MGIFVHVRSLREDEQTLVIQCPACAAENVSAIAYTQADEMSLFFVIPLLTHRTHWVRCPSCRETMLSRLPASDLAGIPPERMRDSMRHRVSPIAKLLAILAIVLCLLPVAGLVMAVPAVIMNFRRRGWARTLSIIALAVTIVMQLAFVALLLYDKGK